MRTRIGGIAVVLAAIFVAPARGEVADKAPTGFTIKTTVTTTATPAVAYASLAEHLSEWWDAAHSYSGAARNMSIRAVPGGCFCETLPDGGGVQHGVVVNVVPGKLLRLQTALGPLQEAGVAGSLTFAFDKAGAWTTITMTYAVGGYYPGGLDTLAPAVDMVLGQQLGLLKQHADKSAARR